MADEAKPRVLVVDDDTSVADTLGMVLNVSGFTATVTYSGKEAVELARENCFDFLVTDVMMEGMNGIEAAVAIRALVPQCRILLISGTNDTASLLAAANAEGNAFDILAKPIHPTVMLEQMRTERPTQTENDLPLSPPAL